MRLLPQVGLLIHKEENHRGDHVALENVGDAAASINMRDLRNLPAGACVRVCGGGARLLYVPALA